MIISKVKVGGNRQVNITVILVRGIPINDAYPAAIPNEVARVKLIMAVNQVSLGRGNFIGVTGAIPMCIS